MPVSGSIICITIKSKTAIHKIPPAISRIFFFLSSRLFSTFTLFAFLFYFYFLMYFCCSRFMLSSFSMCSRWLDLWEGRSRSYRRTKNDPSDIGYNRGTQRIIRVNFSSLLFMRQRGRRKAVSAGSIGWKYRQMSFMSWKIYMKSLYDVIREQSGFWNFCNS